MKHVRDWVPNMLNMFQDILCEICIMFLCVLPIAINDDDIASTKIMSMSTCFIP